MGAKASYKQIFLTNILSCNVTIASIEALQGTEVYRGELKQFGNLFLRHLLRHSTGPTADIWGTDDKSMFLLMDYQTELFEKIGSMKPEDIGVICAMIDKYREQPRKVLNRLEIKLTDSTEQAETSQQDSQ